MKSLFIIIMVILTSTAIFAQGNNTEVLLENYLQVKDALVKSDSKKAALYANEMQKNIEGMEVSDSKEGLLKSIQSIATSKSIEKQRTAFADLSVLTWNLVKGANDVTQDVYYQYCPMKKAYWLSNEEAIRNPYYGAKMLTCGSVKETKKK